MSRQIWVVNDIKVVVEQEAWAVQGKADRGVVRRRKDLKEVALCSTRAGA